MQAERVPFLDTVEGEVLLFHAIADARPVGINAHFNMLQIWLALRRETPEPIQVGDLWAKLRTLYDMDALTAIDLESDKYYTDPTTLRSIPLPPPAPSDNLDKHPFFRREYTLEQDEYIDSLIVARRVRSTPSVSPPPLPRPKGKGRARGKKVKGLKDTGLVPDSDSSALTEDGQEEATATPKGSAFTGTDAGTEEPEEEDPERDASPAPTKKARTAKATATKKAQAKTRAATAAKKKKRK